MTIPTMPDLGGSPESPEQVEGVDTAVAQGQDLPAESQSNLAAEAPSGNTFHMKHLNHIRNIMLQKKAQQEQEAQAAQRTQALARKLAKQVLGSSFDQITSRSWSLPTMSSASRSQAKQQQDADDCSGQDNDDSNDPPTSTRLPSLTEERVAEVSPVKVRTRRVTTSDAENLTGTDSAACKPARRMLQKSVSQDQPSDRSESHSKLPSRNRRTDQTANAQGPGTSLYYQAKATQEANAQLLAKAYGAGATYAAYLQWRRKHKIPDHVKVFCMGGGGHHSSSIRQGLVNRGWHENTDGSSPFFDFKWSISPQDIQYELLWPEQVVNHFSKSHCLTTKVGLCKTIRNLAWYEAADYQTLYPRAYDLSDEVDRAAWVEDTRQCAAAAIVKRAVAEQGVNPGGSDSRSYGCSVDLPTLRLALRVCCARLAQDSFLCCDSDTCSGNPPPPLELTPADYDMLLKHPCLQLAPPSLDPPDLDVSWFDRAFITSLKLPKQGKARQRTVSQAGAAADVTARGKHTAAAADNAQDDSTKQRGYQRDHSCAGSQDSECNSPCRTPDGCSSDNSCPSETSDEPGSNTSSRNSTPSQAHRQGSGDCETAGEQDTTGDQQGSWSSPAHKADDSASPEAHLTHLVRHEMPTLDVTDQQICKMDAREALSLASRVVEVLECWHVQTHMDGMNNIWIVKPAGKSRGRGIRLFNNMDKLMEYIKGEDALSLEWRWVVQKYVERPLIVSCRKFDIRQWVMVTSWSPLCVWFWDTCYLRFAADDYDPSNLDIYLHLSNNSIAKYYQGKKQDDITAQGNMWDVPRFKEWLAEQYGSEDLWERLILPAMQHIVVCTTRCAQDMVQARKNSCQLYGYDFLIDDQLRVWLLEVNSSPTMEASTPITTELCAEVQEDILKLVVDNPPGASPASLGTPADTGRWQCIVDAATELRVPTYTGLSLELKGQGVAAPKKPQPSTAPGVAPSLTLPVWGSSTATRPGQGSVPPPAVAQSSAALAASVYTAGGPAGGPAVTNNVNRSFRQRLSLVEQQSLHRTLQAEKSISAKAVTVPQALNSSPFHAANRLATIPAGVRSSSPKKLPPGSSAPPNVKLDCSTATPAVLEEVTPFGGVISSRVQSARRQSTSQAQPSAAAGALEPDADATPQQLGSESVQVARFGISASKEVARAAEALLERRLASVRPGSASTVHHSTLEPNVLLPFAKVGTAQAQPTTSINQDTPAAMPTSTQNRLSTSTGFGSGSALNKVPLGDAAMLLKEPPLNRSGSLPATVMPRCMVSRNSSQAQFKAAAAAVLTSSTSLQRRVSTDLLSTPLQQLATAGRPAAPSTPPPQLAASLSFMRHSLPSSLISLTALSSNSRSLLVNPGTTATSGAGAVLEAGSAGTLISPRANLWQGSSSKESAGTAFQSTPFLQVRSVGRQPTNT